MKLLKRIVVVMILVMSICGLTGCTSDAVTDTEETVSSAVSSLATDMQDDMR